jgi:hypothetical protein
MRLSKPEKIAIRTFQAAGVVNLASQTYFLRTGSETANAIVIGSIAAIGATMTVLGGYITSKKLEEPKHAELSGYKDTIVMVSGAVCCLIHVGLFLAADYGLTVLLRK